MDPNNPCKDLLFPHGPNLVQKPLYLVGTVLKMAENFENLNNILRDWAKDKVQKSLVKALNRYEKQGEER